MCQAFYIAAGDWVAFEIVCDDRDFLCCRHCRFYRGPSCCYEKRDTELSEFSGKLQKNFRRAARPTRFHLDGFALNIADVTQTVAQRVKNGHSGIGKSRMEKSDGGGLLYLLRLRQRTLRQRTCEPRNECPAPHAITSSAQTRQG